MGPRNLDARSEVGDPGLDAGLGRLRAESLLTAADCVGLKDCPAQGVGEAGHRIPTHRMIENSAQLSINEKTFYWNEEENGLHSDSKRETAERNDTFPTAVGTEGR